MNVKVKPRLLQNFDSSMASFWISPILSEHFDFLFYHEDMVYDNVESLIVFVDPVRQPKIFDKFANSGATVIIDGLWERPDYIKQEIKSNHFVLHNDNWFWYNESLWYQYLNLHNYQPARTYQYRALMPMNLKRFHRDLLYQHMLPYLDDFIWSYASQGKRLPSDHSTSHWNDRYFNPDWYNSTCFSLIAETYVDPMDGQEIFITEKTFKPLAFQHPFMVFGNAGTLKHLKDLGFETYENLFDESYDTASVMQRLKIIEKNVQAFEKNPYDKLTCDKIAHNYNRFFDVNLVKQQIVQEIINPILEHAAI